jgi:hypothetical protein
VRTPATLRSCANFDTLVTVVAVLAGCLLALTAPGFGDYPRDAGPALAAIAHGSLSGFFAHQPAMGAVSLYLRAPFVALAARLHDSAMGSYRWGDLPCLLTLALVAGRCARWAGTRGMSPLGRLLIVVIVLFNPLVANALRLGHPEELLTAAFVAGALLAAADQRVLTAAVLTGLAVASKQWALVIVCPVLLGLERDRLRAGLIALGTAAAATVPMLIVNLASFRHAADYIASPQPNATLFSWLYPMLPVGTARTGLVFGAAHPYSGHLATGLPIALSHPLILVLGVALPLLAWRRHGRHLAPAAMLVAATLVLLLRCTLDAGSWPYYHVALLLTLIVLDAQAGRRLPLAGLIGWAGAFTVLDRFPSYLPIGTANLLYVAFTLGATAVLAGGLYSASERRLDRRPGRVNRLGQLRRIATAGSR